MRGFKESNPRILLVRLSAIGDCILTVPVIHALRKQFPLAHLAWVVDERAAVLLDGLGDLDELLVVPRRWHRSLSTILAVRRALRKRAFDVAIDPQSLTKSGLLSFLSGAPTRIAFARPDGRELAPLLANTRVEPTRKHLAERTLELLRPLGVEGAIPEFQLPCFACHEEILDFADVSTGAKKRYAVVNVGAGWPSKLWTAGGFSEVVRHLGAAHGLSSMIVWHGEEREMAVQIAAQSGGYGHLAPATSLPELATLLREARLLIACDTGPLHLGVALGTPSVGLYGPTDPARCGPYGFPHRAVQPEGGSPLIGMRRSKGNELMQKIRAEQVTAACDGVLADSAARAESPIASRHIFHLHGRSSAGRCAADRSRQDYEQLRGVR